MLDIHTIGRYAWLIPSFTALAFVAIVGLIASGNHNGRLAARIGVGGIALSTVVGVAVFFAALGAGGEELAHAPFELSFAWLPMGAASLDVGIMIDPLAAATVAMVTVVCTMIFIFSTAYMEGELTAYKDPRSGAVDAGTGNARYARFFAYISLFATGMLGFVLSSNLLEALVFWEIMGLCSFLLIGFWYHKPSAAAAAKKAFLTTRIGDLFFFVGIMALYWVFGSVDYTTMLSEAGIEKMRALGDVAGTGVPLSAVIALLVFGGAVGKSAQFPLHVWLPDAMEGPTPVSALIHAATMVSAGVFLVARMYPVFSAGYVDGPGDISGGMFVVAAVGGFTALFAASIAVAQFDIKRVLAYSTLSQLGYMVMALGIGAYVAAVFHLLTHAFFKALLFLGSGSVIHGVEHGMHHAHDHGHGDDHGYGHGHAAGGADPHDPQDMRNMGNLRTRMPLTFWTFLAGTLALTGIPVFAGFWSKDEILAEAFHKGLEGGIAIAGFVWLMGTLAAFLTAFYMARQVFMVFAGPPSTEGARHAPESAPAMVYPLAFLSVFAVLLGFAGVPESFPVLGPLLGNPFHHFVGALTATGAHFEGLAFNAVPAVLSVVVAVAGWALGWFLYGRDPAAARAYDPLRRLGGVWKTLHHKYYVDELYAATAIRASIDAANINAALDKRLVDGLVNLTGRAGEALTRLNGWVDRYIVDGTVNLVGIVNAELGRGLRLVQSGRVQQYLLVAFFSLLALVGAYLW
ncbi:MAG: NADH-quinone oxidoreductase subunit L [Chloroflexi bacterium CFX6]|nr:NADH-quinone oxidoreductase subunit L [Chloroflexi bacterium CFX6]